MARARGESIGDVLRGDRPDTPTRRPGTDRLAGTAWRSAV